MTSTGRTRVRRVPQFKRPPHLKLIFVSSLVVAIALCLHAGRTGHTSGSRQTPASPASRQSRDQARSAYGQTELAFEPNLGQTDKAVDFLARGAGYSMFLRPTEAVVVMTPPKRQAKQAANHPVLRLKLLNSNAKAHGVALDQLAGKTNYLIGNRSRDWRTNIPTYGRVRYEGVYPGIDLVYYGNQRQLEYDLVVAPGGDPEVVRLQFAGAENPRLNVSGDLLLNLDDQTIIQAKPTIYQNIGHMRRPIEGSYTIQENGTVGFVVGEYDHRLPLVIDPTLVYSTYFGGSGTDEARGIVVDSTGNAYICGNTSSTVFPIFNALQPVFGGGSFGGARDVFVTKFDASGTGVFFSTYLGGGGDDKCGRLALDSAGNAYIAGETTSANFPTFNAFQPFYGGGASDAFVTKLNSTGSGLFYSTYFGGSVFDAAGAIAVDINGNAYVTGRTTSPDLYTFNAIQPLFSGGTSADAFVTKFSASGLSVFYSTYLGGSGGLGFDAGLGIAVDAAGNAYVTGQTTSTNFPLLNPIQNTLAGGFPDGDAFVSKFNPSGSALVYSTYLGGSDNDVAQDIAIDANNNAYVTGGTGSLNFPVFNAFQVNYGGNGDAFLTKINLNGTALVYSTYLGGTGNDIGNSVVVDSALHAHVAGATSSTNFPVFNALQPNYGGSGDGFVSKFNVAGTAMIYSTYFGGSNSDRVNGMAIDLADRVYLAGVTASTDFPTLFPFQGTKSTAEDAFIAKINDPPATLLQFSSATSAVTEDNTFVTLTLNRTGDLTGDTKVDFATSDGSAIQRTDYTLASGTIAFAAGETSKTFRVLISEDAYVEANESFSVVLSNPLGGGVGTLAAATVTINDDDTVGPPVLNPIDDANIFVRQHYHDFLAREGDSAGMNFWTNTITQCGSNQVCINDKRIDVSNAFSFENEFQQTGAYVYRIYRELRQ